MKTLIQKIHVEEHHSFACRTYSTPDFETAWHRHKECELIVITQGNGTALIGDYIGEYKPGDVYFLSPNLPHWFRKSEQQMFGSAVVVHFSKDFPGEIFLALPEMKSIRLQLEKEVIGIQLQGELQNQVGLLIEQIEAAEGIERIYLLLQCLQEIGTSVQRKVVTVSFDTIKKAEENSIIELIIDYSYQYFLNPISLAEVAAITSMSIPTFCRFFKRNIKKSYFDFIKEIRVGHACKLLRETNRPVLDICYDSGYNSWAHFSKQFKNVTNISPSRYRKQHAEQ